MFYTVYVLNQGIQLRPSKAAYLNTWMVVSF